MTEPARVTAAAASFAPPATRRPARSRPPRARRRALVWTFNATATAAALGAGVAIGLALTAAGLRNGEDVGAVAVGSWRLPVAEGTPNINPYQRAALAQTGAIPMSAGQGVAFTASRDDAGQKLDRRCTYTIGGPVPRARFWTLGATGADGLAVANAADRFAFTSTDVLRAEGGAFTIAASPHAQPGNWLPVPGRGPFKLVLRLYDSAVPGLGARELGALTLPAITRQRCP